MQGSWLTTLTRSNNIRNPSKGKDEALRRLVFFFERRPILGASPDEMRDIDCVETKRKRKQGNASHVHD